MGVALLVADPYEVMRAGIRTLLANTEFQVVAEAATVKEVSRLAASTPVAAVVTEVHLSDGDGLSMLESLRAKYPELPVVFFSAHRNPSYVARARALGAAAYLFKHATRAEFIEGLRAAVDGTHDWSDMDTGGLGDLAGTRLAGGPLDVPLTQRETQILRQLALGLTNKEIAQALGISYETVKEHVQHILRKLGVADRTQAAVWAVRNHLA